MEHIRLGSVSEGKREVISNPGHIGSAKMTITTRPNIGMVWALLPTAKPTFWFNRLELKPSEQGSGTASYWLKSGIYMADFWDGAQVHRTYIKVNGEGNVAAIYSVMLGPSYAQAWIREQFPKPNADQAGR